MGEVKIPGTYFFTENNISLLQALGLAGDLTINGSREDMILLRYVDGVQTSERIRSYLCQFFGRLLPYGKTQ